MNAQQNKLITFIRTRLIKNQKIQIDENTLLFEKQYIDSMTILDLIGFIEKEGGKKLSSNDIVMENFRTVRAICHKFLNEKT